MGDRTPDVAHLLNLFQTWVFDETIRDRILVTNPEALYDF
jgi:predicted TIM-barrel fold metal-dependent hydrolase